MTDSFLLFCLLSEAVFGLDLWILSSVLTFSDTSRIKRKVVAGLNSFLTAVCVPATIIASVVLCVVFAESMVFSDGFMRDGLRILS